MNTKIAVPPFRDMAPFLKYALLAALICGPIYIGETTRIANAERVHEEVLKHTLEIPGSKIRYSLSEPLGSGISCYRIFQKYNPKDGKYADDPEISIVPCSPPM